MGQTPGPGGGTAGPWYRVQAISAARPGGTADRDYAAMLPAALNAARQGRSFIAGWLSRGGGAPLELITNAGPLIPDEAASPGGSGWPGPGEELLFPVGAQGTAVGGNMLADLDRLVWAACPGRQVPLPDRPAGQAAFPAVPPSLFETALQTLMARPFGWLVVADPTDLLDAETAELRNQLDLLHRYEDEQVRFETDRARRRLAELDAYREAGLWNVRVLVGAATEPDLRMMAPLLVGSVDLAAHPYRLRCPDGTQEFADVLAAKLGDPVDGSQVPFAATAGALAALAGLPRHEVPGVRVIEAGYFDLTSEAGRTGPGQEAIELGRVLDARDRPVGSLRVPLATLNRHALVTGATGTGKSQTVRHMLEELTARGVSWLAIEPAKAEYPAMAARLRGTAAQVTVINPADPRSVPLSVNPLEPEPGYPVQAHMDMVRASFLAAFAAQEPFPQIMAQALERVYADCGWDPQTGAGRQDIPAAPAVPTLARLRAAALAVIAEVGYGAELAADVRGFVDVRLRSLRTGAAGRFFEGGHPADVGALLGRNVVLALEDVANDEDKAFLIGTLLIRIVEHLRLREKTSPSSGLRHVIVLEEAHRLLRAGRDGAGGHAVELFAGMLAEIRAYGQGIVIAEQIPAKLVPDVVKNTALKVVHRLPAADDRQLVGAAMNLDANQSRQVVSMLPGEAAVFADGMDRPLRIRVPYGGDREARAAVTAGAVTAGAVTEGAVPEGTVPEGAVPEGAVTAGTVPEGAVTEGVLTDGALPAAGVVLAGPPSAGPMPVAARRSAACGRSCAGERPCTLVEIRAAEVLATAPEDAWLRVWAEVYLLAHLANRPRPRVPVPLRERWASLDPRLRECLLASALDRALGGREQALRSGFDPRELAAACAQHAAGMLDGGTGAGAMPGTMWVLPQLRWLHELERVCPLDGPAPDPFAPAPPLDYTLAGLAGRAQTKVGQRISALRRHPLSMAVPRNRLIAWTALLGEDDQSEFIQDLAAVAIGVSHRGQLRKAAGEMGVSGWLEAVLSWPRRFIVGGDDLTVAPSARRPEPPAG